MPNGWLWWVLAIVVCCFGAASHNEARQTSSAGQYAGTWAGTWDGADAGAFELTLEKGKVAGGTWTVTRK